MILFGWMMNNSNIIGLHIMGSLWIFILKTNLIATVPYEMTHCAPIESLFVNQRTSAWSL